MSRICFCSSQSMVLSLGNLSAANRAMWTQVPVTLEPTGDSPSRIATVRWTERLDPQRGRRGVVHATIDGIGQGLPSGDSLNPRPMTFPTTDWQIALVSLTLTRR